MEIWRGNLNYGLCVLVIKSSNENVKQYDLISWLFECSMGSVVYLTKCAGRMFGIRDLHPSRNGYWTLFYIFSLLFFVVKPAHFDSFRCHVHSERPGVVRGPGWAEREGGQAEGWTRGVQESDEWCKCLLGDVTLTSLSRAELFTHQTRVPCWLPYFYHVSGVWSMYAQMFSDKGCHSYRPTHTHTNTHTHTHPLLLTSFSSAIEKYIMPESLPRQAFIEKSSNSSCRSGVLPVLCSSVLFPGSSAPVWYTAVIYCSGLSHSLCLLRDKYSQDVVFLFIVLILTFWCLPHCRFSCCFLCLTSSPMMCESRDRYVWDVWVVDLLRHVDWLISQFRSCG